MSNFGGAGLGQKVYKPNPPERGSFPLDHDGECKSIMHAYLRCIKSHRGTNDSVCRDLSKSYLSCRMERDPPTPITAALPPLYAVTLPRKQPNKAQAFGARNSFALKNLR
ncbi:hypothetical protein LEMA_P050020.1 [Plenodomus lingam JN3]|uniref:CHCH domain-containing protein n=1 Tax=Leptosphaeria maculans (strain JN3 / isolate v23.1.3 / race Av1-4-5-6-7-8) TaxID=985895 RepID=E4ZLD7_LEPMJ|nr:hypothetical protein LEMA_P050020.1 [Plenodomus lingam JN3]CBX92296.1 hypothetical protein LEMA_P050020.1 [Plenodomus lingam JN3]